MDTTALMFLASLLAQGLDILDHVNDQALPGDAASGTTSSGVDDGAPSPDSDGDTLSDEVEAWLGTNPRRADTDRDGLNDAEDFRLGTDPLVADTDGDGLLDGEEVDEFGTDPLLADTDGDGLLDGEEVSTYGTDPSLADTDGDGLLDGDEVDSGSDPLFAPPPQYRFVYIHDLAFKPGGEFPGADIDAISVTKKNGAEYFAQTLEVVDIDCSGNLSCDAYGLLGAPDVIDPADPDDRCFNGDSVRGNEDRFTALNGGFVVVQFSSVENGDVYIENGDQIHVFEIGATECNGRFDHDPVSVSVSTDADLKNAPAIEIGTTEYGNNIIEVSGL